MTNNVIRPNFGGRKTELVHPEPVAPVSEPEKIKQEGERLAVDVLFYVQHTELIALAYHQGEEMTNFVFDVLGVTKKDESVELRRGVVAQYSLEQLATRLAHSSRRDWSREPHFFGATYVELDARRTAIEFILEKMKAEEISQNDPPDPAADG
jgi:hypothetical protein